MENKDLSEVFSYLPEIEKELKQMEANPESISEDRLIEMFDKILGDLQNIKTEEDAD
jgi:hypothetical protein